MVANTDKYIRFMKIDTMKYLLFFFQVNFLLMLIAQAGRWSATEDRHFYFHYEVFGIFLMHI